MDFGSSLTDTTDEGYSNLVFIMRLYAGKSEKECQEFIVHVWKCPTINKLLL